MSSPDSQPAPEPDTGPPAAIPEASAIRAITHEVRAARRAPGSNDLARRRRHLLDRLPAWLDEPLPADAMAKVIEAIERAAARGDMVADVYRFPADYCTDRARAVNNDDPAWPATLRGPAQAMHDLLVARLRPAGYAIGAVIATWPALMPGDVALLVSWRDQDNA